MPTAKYAALTAKQIPIEAIMDHLEGNRYGRVITREPTLEDAYIELVDAA